MHPLISEVQKASLQRVPEVRTGYTVRVHQKIKEGEKERVQVFEGLVIKVGHGEGVEKTITVRKIVEGIGVEKVFPIHSPNIVKIDVRKKAKIRRAKLYYMRERSGKSARLQERQVSDQERAEEDARMDALIAEAVKADEKLKAQEVAAQHQEDQAASVSAEATVDTAAEEVVAETAPETEPAEAAEDKQDAVSGEAAEEEPAAAEPSEATSAAADSGEASEGTDEPPAEEKKED